MFGIDDIVGAFTGGGGGSSSSVTSTVNLNVAGLNDMKQTVQGGDKPIAVTEVVELKPLTLNENVNVGGTDKPIGVDLAPVTLNENIDLQPVTLNENIDLQPVAVDTCQTFRLAPLPETEVCQPYRHHIGYTMFGVEYMGVSYDGESKQLIDSHRRPQVVERLRHHEHHAPPAPKEFSGDRGIRVRVLGPDE